MLRRISSESSRESVSLRPSGVTVWWAAPDQGPRARIPGDHRTDDYRAEQASLDPGVRWCAVPARQLQTPREFLEGVTGPRGDTTAGWDESSMRHSPTTVTGGRGTAEPTACAGKSGAVTGPTGPDSQPRRVSPSIPGAWRYPEAPDPGLCAGSSQTLDVPRETIVQDA